MWSDGVATDEMFQVRADLTELDQWVLWRSETREGRPTKVPYQANGRLPSSTDPQTWTSYETALGAQQQALERYSGIGFVFAKADGFSGIDPDNCMDEAGHLKPWALPIIGRFWDTYAEISPSGWGVKIWGEAKVPDLLRLFHKDHGNALRLIALPGRDLRYCYALRKWLAWDGRRWPVDETDRAGETGKVE